MIVLAWFYVMSYLPDLQCEPDILPTHRLISLDDVTPVSLFALTIFHLVHDFILTGFPSNRIKWETTLVTNITRRYFICN